MDSAKMIRIHAGVLVICSLIGFTGHYLQYGILRITACIPATIGVIVFLLHRYTAKQKGCTRFLPWVVVLVFGITTTNMCIRFLPQDCQPIRKKIIFTCMSLSAWVTMYYGVKKNDTKH